MSTQGLQWLTEPTNQHTFSDFRPTVSADTSGNLTVVFERTNYESATELYVIAGITDLDDPPPAVKLLEDPPSGCTWQSRPDFCRTTNQILFNGAETADPPVSVWEVDLTDKTPNLIGLPGYYYPTWDILGMSFVTTNGSGAPVNTIFNPMGKTLEPNIDGDYTLNVLDPIPLYGGMPTLGPKNLPQIAFAGQPADLEGGWGPDHCTTYQENYNYIFLNELTVTDSGPVFTSAPMESGANMIEYDANYQGRAPSWSADGAAIAFESNRPPSPSLGNYAIWLWTPAGDAVPVTDSTMTLDAQHAKFFPDGTTLIFAAQYDATSPQMGIAWIDVSSLVNP